MKKECEKGNLFRFNKKGQVWVETVVYTLIAFVILGAVLGFAKPKIENLQDKSTIKNSIGVLKDMDKVVREVSSVAGNKRKLEIEVDRGYFLIDSESDSINYEIETSYSYSEPGQTIKEGNVEIKNEDLGEINRLNAKIPYEGQYNLTLGGEEGSKKLTSSSTSYEVLISNKGKQNNAELNIDFEVI